MKWLDDRKEQAHTHRKRKTNRVDVVDYNCECCGHHKAFRKKEYIVCTRCKARYKR